MILNRRANIQNHSEKKKIYELSTRSVDLQLVKGNQHVIFIDQLPIFSEQSVTKNSRF